MELAAKPNPDPRAVLTKALLNAGRTLGLSQEALGAIIGRDRSSIARGLDPDSKAGELALLLLRCYRSLYSLVGGRQQDMRHWMHTASRDIGGIPAEQVHSVAGLVRVVEYLDASGRALSRVCSTVRAGSRPSWPRSPTIASCSGPAWRFPRRRAGC